VAKILVTPRSLTKGGDPALKTLRTAGYELVFCTPGTAPDEAELLEIRAAQPCLVLTRRTWSSQMVVTFVRCIHPGSRYRLGSRFRVSGPQWFG